MQLEGVEPLPIVNRYSHAITCHKDRGVADANRIHRASRGELPKNVRTAFSVDEAVSLGMQICDDFGRITPALGFGNLHESGIGSKGPTLFVGDLDAGEKQNRNRGLGKHRGRWLQMQSS